MIILSTLVKSAVQLTLIGIIMEILGRTIVRKTFTGRLIYKTAKSTYRIFKIVAGKTYGATKKFYLEYKEIMGTIVKDITSYGEAE